MARKDRLGALCGVVAGRFAVRPLMSGGASGAISQRMITWIVQRVAAVRAAGTLEGALLAETLCWDGPMRSMAIESAMRKVICLGFRAFSLIDRDEIHVVGSVDSVDEFGFQLTPCSSSIAPHSPPHPTSPLPCLRSQVLGQVHPDNRLRPGALALLVSMMRWSEHPAATSLTPAALIPSPSHNNLRRRH
jgi:hypothetical protein